MMILMKKRLPGNKKSNSINVGIKVYVEVKDDSLVDLTNVQEKKPCGGCCGYGVDLYGLNIEGE